MWRKKEKRGGGDLAMQRQISSHNRTTQTPGSQKRSKGSFFEKIFFLFSPNQAFSKNPRHQFAKPKQDNRIFKSKRGKSVLGARLIGKIGGVFG